MEFTGLKTLNIQYIYGPSDKPDHENSPSVKHKQYNKRYRGKNKLIKKKGLKT